jgi:hypothetical protein
VQSSLQQTDGYQRVGLEFPIISTAPAELVVRVVASRQPTGGPNQRVKREGGG